MGWLSKLFGEAVPAEAMDGIRLEHPRWEVDGPKYFSQLFVALHGWLPDGTILYFEGGSPDAPIEKFMAEHSIPEPMHVAMSTIWPRPRVFHVPATEAVLTELAEIMEHHASPELAQHFHVYRQKSVLLQWHDACFDPLLLSPAVSEDQVRDLAERLGTRFRPIEGIGEEIQNPNF